MNVVGIIAEYNPFHNGHALHLREAKKQSTCDYAIAVMSGHFTQRGEPAILNKWHRAEMAVSNGIDLVIELPTVFSVRSAEYFAHGSIQLLNRLNVVNSLAFGAESNDLHLLNTLAATQYNENEIRNNREHAISSAQNMFMILQNNSNTPIANLLTPNNILAIEYLKALKKTNSVIEPVLIARQHVQHNSLKTKSTFSSATNIRKQILSQNLKETKPFLPTICYEKIYTLLNAEKLTPLDIENFMPYIFFQIYTTSPKKLSCISGIKEGLENCLLNSIKNSATINELLLKTKSKRYLYTRLQRILVNILLQIQQIDTENYDNQGPQYARVLAFNRRGREILKKAKTKSSIPIITKTTAYINEKSYHSTNQSKTTLQEMLSIDIKSTDVYNLALLNKKYSTTGVDFYKTPIYRDS